jgi:hypothetical protein
MRMTAASGAWCPAIARFVSTLRFRVNCYWCGGRIEVGAPSVWYPKEKLNAHCECHAEACCS